MKATVDNASLWKAISCVDYGYVTDRSPAAAYVELCDGSIEIRVPVCMGCHDLVLSAATAADAGKDSGKVCVRLYDLLQAAKRLKKAKPGLATLETSGGDLPSLSISRLGTRTRVRCFADDGYTGPTHYSVEGPRVEASRESLMPAFRMLASLKPDDAGFAESLGIAGGYAFATDRYTLRTSRCDLPDGALPRVVVLRLLAAADWPSVSVAMRDDGYVTGELHASMWDVAVHYSWREGGAFNGEARDPTRAILRDGGAQKLVSRLRTARPWTCAGAALRQALRECKPFCTKGDAVVFSPHEAGAHLLRYDLADDKTAAASVLDAADACETLCLTEWPFPAHIALPRKQIADAVKKAETVTFRVLGDTAALEIDGDPVMQLMIERACPFLDRASI